jgi:DNA-binding GntR family transcriptional regulator
VTSEPTAIPNRLPRATYASMVTEWLRDNIVNGSLEPGTQLSEVDLATSFGVSRGPVREALQRLIQEGLVRSEPHRGVFVPVLSDEDVVDIYLVRDALESSAVKHIISSSKAVEAADALDGVVKLMADAVATGDWERVGTYDLQFHTVLVASTDSPRLQRMFNTVISETQLCLGVLTAADAREDLVDEHRRIAREIREGNTSGALAVLKEHFDDAIVVLRNRQRVAVGERPEKRAEMR